MASTPAGKRGGRSRRRRKSRLVPALALVSVAGTAAIAAWVVLSQRTRGEDPEDIGVGIPAPDVRQIGAGGHATIRITDEDDPSRRVAEIAFDSQTPIGQGRYDTVKPRAWLYLTDGGYMYIRADEGRFYAPDEQRPQSGVMRGDVVVKVFDPAAERPADDATAPVEVRLTSLSFDTEYGGGWSEEPVEGVTPEGTFRLGDLRFVYNEVEGRIELLEVRGGGVLTYTPVAKAESPATPTTTDPATAPLGMASPSTSEVVAVAARQPAAQPEPSDRGQGESSPAPAPARAPGQARAEADPLTFYAAQFREQVRLTQGDASASGDLLEVWARVQGSRLAEGPIDGAPPAPAAGASVSWQIREAIASAATASTRKWPPLRMLRQGAAQPEPADAQPGVESQPPAEPLREVRVLPEAGLAPDEPVTLAWSGPLTLRPLAAEPTELRREHLAARMTGGEGGGVTLADGSSGADGVCAQLEYGFTTRSVVLAGVGETGMRLSAGAEAGGGAESGAGEAVSSEADGVAAAPTGRATLRGGRLEHFLATGVGRVPGPGSLEGSGFHRIEWSRQMDFVLRTLEGRVLAAPEEVILQGDVRGEDDAASFDAGFARAVFVAARGPAGQTGESATESVLSRIFLDENVTLRGREEERVAAQTLNVAFEESAAPGKPTPTWFEADGAVTATRPGERIAAEHVEATLVPSEGGNPEVQTLAAEGAVDFQSRREGLAIAGDDLAVDVAAQRLRVLGTEETLARVTRGPTTVSGVDVRLAGLPRSAAVYGRGKFEHEAVGAAGTPEGASESAATAVVTFEAVWSQVMTFDDTTGALRTVGDVEATMREGDHRIDRMSAWTIEATIDPAAPVEGDVGGVEADAGGSDESAEPGAIADAEGALPGLIGDVSGPGDQNRRLRTMVATGSLADSPTGEPAQIESRRYGPRAADGSAVLTQLLYLEGARIIADNQAGTLDVPGAGKLLVVDRRTPDEERPASASPLSGEARGDGLFNWTGSLRVERNRGEMTMRDGVSMVHRRTDGLVTRLTAPVLTARASGGAGTAEDLGRLTAVHAEGGVWVQSGEQEVTAEVIDYDAETGILTAHSPLGGSVRIAQGGSVWTAAAIRWNMPSGRIDIIEPGSIVAPR